MPEEPAIPEIDPNKAAVDVAYEILKGAGETLDYRELLDKVVEIKAIVTDDLAKAMSRIYTEINLDPRFVYMGQGAWGLKEWLPKAQVARGVSAHASPLRSRQPERWHEEGSLDEPDTQRRPDEDEEDWNSEPD
ncbi:MAG: DNA-directed RNA polymerase subunit delta [Firmicutes bacterium]|nr:DNA-directed RNA polymerase subunit delta [Bacillota bacterium]